MCVLLFLMVGIGYLISLPVFMPMRNAQSTSGNGSNTVTSSSQTGDGNKSKDQNQKDSTAKEMGICLVGAGGPCNADSNWDGRHDVTGKCVLLNSCGNDNGNNNKSTNNNISGK
jgi:hypothetical protein